MITLFAHAFGQRYELPIPLLLFVLGGAGIVLVSFLLVLPHKVAAARLPKQIDGELPGKKAKGIWGALSVAVLAALIATGLFGSQEVPENILPTLFWLVVWIAIPLSCGMLGDWTRALNPFAWATRLADSERLRQVLLGRSKPFTWPEKLGWWPAVATFFIIACGELVYNQTATKPAVTATSLLAYFIVSAFFGLLYGRGWLARGEVFSVLFATWGVWATGGMAHLARKALQAACWCLLNPHPAARRLSCSCWSASPLTDCFQLHFGVICSTGCRMRWRQGQLDTNCSQRSSS